MKARTAFREMIKHMEMDEDIHVSYTHAEEETAVKAIETMMEAGWQPWFTTQSPGILTGLNYINDMEVFACGQKDDIKRLSQHWQGGEILSQVLKEIHDGEH